MITYSVSTWQQPTPAPASAERTALIGTVAREITGLGAGRLRVGIDGLTAAGKTSFGHELAAAIATLGRPVLRASLDDFKRPWREAHLYDRLSGEGYYRNAFDYDRVRSLLLVPDRVALCAIDPLTQVDHSGVLVDAPEDSVLLVDGVFAFRPEIDEFWDHRIWLEIDAELSVRRGELRDGADPQQASLHRSRYLPAERIYLAEADPRSRVNVVIDNSVIESPVRCS
ncbi:uridine kinase [Pseudonocardiaceae bacterium YIM PH 21723]|nr:uridine kinase [Pseudonocardiaceae bacterium YIM PH 21723]